jgi:hypothetical protein
MSFISIPNYISAKNTLLQTPFKVTCHTTNSFLLPKVKNTLLQTPSKVTGHI